MRELIDNQVKTLFQRGIDQKKNSIPIELQPFERDTTFLLNKDFEEYGDELETNIYDHEPVTSL